MADLNLSLFRRFLWRAEEIALEPGMKTSVLSVYNDILKPKAEPYLVLDAAVVDAESQWGKENREATEALDALSEPYRTARAVLLAYYPDLVLPELFSQLPTDVEKTHAIEELIDKVDDHTGQAWADDILAGPLGTKGPDVVRNIEEAIAASKNLSEAREKRAVAYGPTYDAFLRFKRVVRSALGSSSKQYRRIHGRAAARAEDNGGSGGSGGDPTGGDPTGGGGGGGPTS